MSWPSGTPHNMTPEQRVERAKHAARVRNSTENHIKVLTRRTLTDEHRAMLAALLGRPNGADQ